MWFLFLIPFLLISGCSINEESSETNTNKEQPPRSEEERKANTVPAEQKKTPPRQEDPGTVVQTEGSFQPHLEYKESNGIVEFTFSVKNQTGHPFTYRFNTTQRYDYIIKNSNGEIIKQLSKEQTFKKLPAAEFIKPNGALLFKESIGPLPKGTYHATFVLTAKEWQPKETITFKID
jgi:hypothetical protein